MTHNALHIVAIAAALAGYSSSAEAACYADYKAKKPSPLKLHYGVIEIPAAACANKNAARQIIQSRIKNGGWDLLNVISVFGPDGLSQRKQSAGQYYLRF